MKLKQILTAATIAGCGIASSYATTTVNGGLLTPNAWTGYFDGGRLSPTNSGSTAVSGPFDYTYEFSVPSSGATFNAIVFGWWGINASDFAATINGTPLIFSYATIAVPYSQSYPYLSLSATGVTGVASYSLHVTGSLMAGVTGASYNIGLNSVAVAPVPEPETFAMLLAGLGLVGFVARRRNKAQTA